MKEFAPVPPLDTESAVLKVGAVEKVLTSERSVEEANFQEEVAKV